MPDGKLRAYYKGHRPVKGPDRALPLDVPRVDFVTILGKVVHECMGNSTATDW